MTEMTQPPKTESEKKQILELKEGESVCLNMREEGGAEVFLKYELYFLFEIPIYGGMPNFHAVYGKHTIDTLIKTYQSWT